MASVLALAFCLTPVFADINPVGDTIRRVQQAEIDLPSPPVAAIC
jgi:hypothetical protein